MELLIYLSNQQKHQDYTGINQERDERREKTKASTEIGWEAG